MARSALETTAAYYREAGAALRLFRLALAASDRIAPPLAVRAAYRLFLTPLPPRWLARRHAWEPGWRIERWPFERTGLTVYTRPAAPARPAALLVHGWSGNARQMLPLAQVLAQQGLWPVLLDLPAHGRSPGTTSNLPQFARAIDYVVARFLQHGHAVRVVAAHSLAASAAAFAAGRGLPVQRLVLIAPPASPRAYTRHFAEMFGLSEATRLAMLKRIEAREGVLMSQFEPEAAGPRVHVPTLVVHDRDDGVNRFADGQAFARAIPGAQLLATEGLGHRHVLKDPLVAARIALFAA